MDGVRALDYLRRPEASYRALLERVGPPPEPLSPEEMDQVEIRAKWTRRAG